MADGGNSSSSVDALLKKFAAGVSAPPAPPETGPSSSGVASSPKPAVAPADVPQATSANGWQGILDIYKNAGGLTADQYSAQATGILKQIQDANKPAIRAVEQGVGQRQAIMAQPVPHPPVPQLQAMPAAPDTRMKNPLNVFQNVGTVLAMLGSAFTRRPMVTAMNSAAAAIKGYAAGDKDAAERAHSQWKDSLEAAVSQNQAEMDQYKTLLENTKLDYADREAQLQAIAASNNDQTMLAALRSGAPQMAFQILDGRQKAAESLTQLLVQAQQRDEQMALERARLAETQKYHGALTGANNPGGGPLDPETVQMLATQYLGGDASALQGLGYGRQGMLARQQVLKAASTRVGQQGGGGDIAANRATYKAVSAALRNTANYVNRATIAESTFLKNLEIVKKTMTQGVGGTPSPLVNKWVNATREQIEGDPQLKAFDIAIQTAAREYGRIVSGAVSNAMLTDSAREESAQMLSSMLNPDQINAAIGVMTQDVTNAIDSNKEEMQEMQRQLEAIGDVPGVSESRSDSAAPQPPKVGDIIDGYKFKGGDPADPNNWAAVQ